MAEEQTTQQKRQVAVKAKIAELINGKYVKEEGWQPNYILTDGNRNISRVNLLGVVVGEPSVEQNNQNLTIDDGTGRINIRSFDGNVVLNKYNLGDVVLLIGRPREYNDEKYLIPEIIKKIEDKNWIEVRKKELEKLELLSLRNKEKVIENPILVEEERIESVEEEKVEVVETAYEKIINKIREMDGGEGVNVDELVGLLNDPNSEKTINNLLEQGEIFEVKPGMVKVLE